MSLALDLTEVESRALLDKYIADFLKKGKPRLHLKDQSTIFCINKAGRVQIYKTVPHEKVSSVVNYVTAVLNWDEVFEAQLNGLCDH